MISLTKKNAFIYRKYLLTFGSTFIFTEKCYLVTILLVTKRPLQFSQSNWRNFYGKQATYACYTQKVAHRRGWWSRYRRTLATLLLFCDIQCCQLLVLISERPKWPKWVSAETEISAKLTENSGEISAETVT